MHNNNDNDKAKARVSDGIITTTAHPALINSTALGRDTQEAAQAALAYAQEQAWAVLPLHGINAQGGCTCGRADCPSPGKHPLTLHGVLEASKDADTIRAWWQKWPYANVGIATGQASGIIALDVDVAKGGEESLWGLEQRHGKLPDTVEQITGGGGRHILFRHPGAGAGVANKVGIAPGLDVRGDGGYIVAAPSIHISGRRYEWEASSQPDKTPLAEPPLWLLELVGGTGRRLTPEDWERVIPEGERNVELTRRAGSLLAQRIPASEVRTMLIAWSKEHCRPPLPEDEIKAIVASIAKREAAKPKDEPGLPQLTPTRGYTDMDNATRLVERHGDDLRHCWPWRKWLVWDRTRWKVDDTAEVVRRAKETVRAMVAEALNIEDSRARRMALSEALKCQSKVRVDAMLALAASEPRVPVLPEDLDNDKWALNVLNGTLDLRTGTLRPHRREDLLTKIAPVEYDDRAECPRWRQFLHEIMAGNERLVSFLQRAVGMSLTGDTSEHVLLILYGTGRNGKSTLLNTLLALLGDYSILAAPELLMAKRGERHPTELVDLFGKRLVVSMESEEGRRLAEALIKQLTGGDKVRARRMREDFWEYWPTHKLWLATNHKPQVHGTDIAIWSRLKLVPFSVTFREDQQDKHLLDKLLAERAGILRWAVEGCLAWQQDGLDIPEEVTSATEAYREEEDVLAAFITECCVVRQPGVKALAKPLYTAYSRWCQENGELAVSQRRFGMQLAERGFTKTRSSLGNVWHGIALLERERCTTSV